MGVCFTFEEFCLYVLFVGMSLLLRQHSQGCVLVICACVDKTQNRCTQEKKRTIKAAEEVGWDTKFRSTIELEDPAHRGWDA